MVYNSDNGQEPSYVMVTQLVFGWQKSGIYYLVDHPAVAIFTKTALFIALLLQMFLWFKFDHCTQILCIHICHLLKFCILICHLLKFCLHICTVYFQVASGWFVALLLNYSACMITNKDELINEIKSIEFIALCVSGLWSIIYPKAVNLKLVDLNCSRNFLMINNYFIKK